MIETAPLLSKTDALIRKMHVLKADFGLSPHKDHIGTCIQFSDLQQMRTPFVREMLATVTQFVYSAAKRRSLKEQFTQEGRDEDAAAEMLSLHARAKFRPTSIRGQFSELLLYNLLQHHFSAAPLLRKMAITTNPGLERNGADAFHIAKSDDKYLLYLGEAKTYGSSENKNSVELKDVLKKSIKSVIEHYESHRNELNLYVYDDFIPKELEEVAKAYLEGRANNVEVHLVCLVTYHVDEQVTGNDAQELATAKMELLRSHAAAVSATCYSCIPENLLPRMNYVLFPVRALDELLTIFHQQLGIFNDS